MRRLLFSAIVCASVGLAALGALAQNPPAQGQSAQGQATQPKPSTDPYINNKDAGKTQFPLAAPAGTASNARAVAPAGAVNQGQFDPSAWKYGPAFNAPPNARSGIRSSSI
jgi:hypothetical protein